MWLLLGTTDLLLGTMDQEEYNNNAQKSDGKSMIQDPLSTFAYS